MSLTSILGRYDHLADSASQSALGVKHPVLQSLHAEGTVHGLLLEMRVDQTYVNPGNANIEAIYTFPLPVNAVLLALEFEIGGRTLTGKVVDKGDSEERYEEAMENGDTAVLLERAADGLYTANVGNLLAREKAVVRLHYAQLLSFSQGQVRITVPNVIAPRFGASETARLRIHQTPAHDIRTRHPFSMSVRLHGPVACGQVSSPSHSLAVRHAGGAFDVRLAQPSAAMLDRDFVLLCDGLEGGSITTVGRDGDGHVALASFCPAPENEAPHRPLKLKLLVDCSGSMNGDSIKSARKALHEILPQLKATDRFSYSRFGSTVAHHNSALMAASARAISEASIWIADTAANLGNTEMRQALLSTFALGQPGNADILLITDGHIWDTDPLVASATKAGQRIFAVGVGAAPAASLLQRLATGTGGSCELVGVNDDVHAAVLRMFRRMRQAPVCNVAVTWDGCCEWKSGAGKTVFTGETVHASAGFAGPLPSSALIAWTDAEGNTRELAIPVDGNPIEGDTLARVAAAMRLDTLPAEQRHTLALQYQLVSATTSLLIVHERSEDERPTVFPLLRMAPQMQTAGYGGLGTVERRKGVAVWRRETASEQMQAMMRNSVETYDVPAFLRRTERVVAFVYREQLRVFLHEHMARVWARCGPADFAEVEEGLPEQVLRQLQDIAEMGYPPQEVIARFIIALHACFHRGALPIRLLKRLRSLGREHVPVDYLDKRVAEVARLAFHHRHVEVGPYDIPAFLRKQAD